MNDYKNKEEQKLIEACKKDITAFEKLYKSYIKDVYRYVYVVVRNKEIAEDITSQTFLVAIEKVQNFEWRGISIKYWFLKIARNLVSKYLGKPQDLSFDERLEIKNLDQILIEDIVVEEELIDKLKELIFKLDDTTKEIISLRIWEELGFKEISNLVNLKHTTVGSKFSRGVKKLQKLVEKEDSLRQSSIPLESRAKDKKDKKDKKLYSVNLVPIIVGIKYLKKIPEFLPSSKFISNLTTRVSEKINLLIKNNAMNSIRQSKISQSKFGSILSGKGLYIIIGILGIALVTGILGITGYLLTDKEKDDAEPAVTQEKEEDSSTELTSPEEDDSVTDQTPETEVNDTNPTDTEKPVDPYVGWKTYNKEWLFLNINYRVDFKYPSDWKVIESKDFDKGYSDSNISIVSSDDQYRIRISTFGPTDSIPCYYSDAACESDKSARPRYCFSEYKEIVGDQYTFRISQSKTEDSDYTVCGGVPDTQQQIDFKHQLVSMKNDTYYNSGYITYFVPDSTDSKVIKDIELMLQSMSI